MEQNLQDQQEEKIKTVISRTVCDICKTKGEFTFEQGELDLTNGKPVEYHCIACNVCGRKYIWSVESDTLRMLQVAAQRGEAKAEQRLKSHRKKLRKQIQQHFDRLERFIHEQEEER